MTQHLPLDISSLRALPDGSGFELECRDGEQGAIRLRFTAQAMERLMRDLPRVEAALQEARPVLSGAISARPVADWYVGQAGPDEGVAICLRTPGDVDSGFSFGMEDARAFHRELGNTLLPVRCVAETSSPAVARWVRARPERV